MTHSDDSTRAGRRRVAWRLGLTTFLLGVTNLAAADTAVDPATLAADRPLPGAVWLEDLDFSQSAERLRPRASAKGTPLTVAGRVYRHGLGGVGRSQLLIALDGLAERFVSVVGIDDVEKSNGSKRFALRIDGQRVAESPVLRKGQFAVLSVALAGARELELTVDHGGIESDWDRFALGGAQLVLTEAARNSGARPRPFALAPEPTMPIAASSTFSTPSINGPAVLGGTPGRPFLYRVPVSGQPPLTLSARGLPRGLRFDATAGVLSGTTPTAGRHAIVIEARGPAGRARRRLTLVSGEGAAVKALTPPMGWNSWNVWGMNVDAGKVRAAADAMVKSGLAAHGFRYVNIDDGWEGQRDACGRLQTNEKFGDMSALADYVHALGLRIGIYSSPGPKTCGGMEGSYQHESIDARTFADWGIDLLKYDYCSFDELKKDGSPAEQRRPYETMQAALARVDRDIVYSVCNYGRGEVWTWGEAVDGNLWRTTSDITDSWVSLDGIAFSQSDKAPFARPGHWNDPDMLIVGKLGWGEAPRPTRLSGNEQILHITHWAMLAAPLLIGADMNDLDRFTLDLLTNDEVIAVDQDEGGQAGARKAQHDRTEVWARPLADGGLAVALYNRGPRATTVTARWSELGISGRRRVRDLWQRRDLGVFADAFSAEVPQHGAVFVKLQPARARQP